MTVTPNSYIKNGLFMVSSHIVSKRDNILEMMQQRDIVTIGKWCMTCWIMSFLILIL